jgi:DNA-directed RNA polymerase specialized sigma24 family protein
VTGQAAAQSAEAHLASRTATDDDGLLYVLFLQHYSQLVRFAATASGSLQHGEDAVQDAFARLFVRPRRLRDRAAAEAYLRSAVLNAARSNHHRRSRDSRPMMLPARWRLPRAGLASSTRGTTSSPRCGISPAPNAKRSHCATSSTSPNVTPQASCE